MAWLSRRRRDPRVDLVAELVRAYHRVYGRPLRGAARVAALLAALAYLNPENGAARSKPLRLGISFYLDPAAGLIVSDEVRTLLEEAADEGLVSIRSETCYETVPELCDSPPYTYAYAPGRKKPNVRTGRLPKLIAAVVRRFGAMDPRIIARLVLDALGVKKSTLHHVYHPIPLEELAAA